MTTVLTAVACLIAGGLLTASSRPAVRVAGICAFGAGVFLWFGLSVLCGDGPLMNCAVVQ